MRSPRIRKATMHFEFEISQDTKDQIEDLLTQYPDEEIIVAKAIATLHAEHFGSPTDEKKPMPKFVMSPSDNGSYQKMDELLKYMKVIASQREHQKIIEKMSADPEEVKQLTEEANKKILEKIDELGVKFSKIEPDVKERKGTKSVPTEMSKEEILQLLQRIDKLESKLTRAISQARISSATTPSRGRKLDDMTGDVPKIGKIEGGDAVQQDSEDRPLLDDVLSTVIVSVEKEED